MTRAHQSGTKKLAPSQQIFERLFRKHYEEIRRYVAGMYPEHAEDIVQDTFMKLLTNIDNVEEQSVRAWLYRVASNKGIDLTRANRSRAKRHEQSHTPQRTTQQTTEVQALVRLAMQRLAPKQAQLLHLYGAGLSYDEMADVMQVKKSSISQLLLRAKRAFEHELALTQRSHT